MKRSELYDQVRFEVEAGVASAKQIFDHIGWRIGSVEDPSANFDQKVRGLAAKLLRERDALERTWKDRSTNDDLDDALAALNARGIVALQDPGWTQSMGWDAAHEARLLREKAGETVRGAVFYHTQDLERALQGEGLYLAFGAFVDNYSAEADRAIAREVCEVLAEHGIACSWDGAADQRVRILPFPWRKRRSSKAPPRSRAR